MRLQTLISHAPAQSRLRSLLAYVSPFRSARKASPPPPPVARDETADEEIMVDDGEVEDDEGESTVSLLSTDALPPMRSDAWRPTGLPVPLCESPPASRLLERFRKRHDEQRTRYAEPPRLAAR